MTYELGHRFIQKWKQLPGYERNQLIGELSDLVTLLSTDQLPTKPKHAAAISETQESLFEDLPDTSAWLAPTQAEPTFEQNAAASQPQSPVEATHAREASHSTDLDDEFEPHLISPAMSSSDGDREEMPYHISSDLNAQMMPGIADLEAIEWGDEPEEQLIDEAFFNSASATTDTALRLQVEQIVDQWWLVEREKLVREVLVKINQS
jgi:hypothetical protein